MSIFGKIKDAIFGHKAAAQTAPATDNNTGNVDLGQSTGTQVAIAYKCLHVDHH